VPSLSPLRGERQAGLRAKLKFVFMLTSLSPLSLLSQTRDYKELPARPIKAGGGVSFAKMLPHFENTLRKPHRE